MWFKAASLAVGLVVVPYATITAYKVGLWGGRWCVVYQAITLLLTRAFAVGANPPPRSQGYLSAHEDSAQGMS